MKLYTEKDFDYAPCDHRRVLVQMTNDGNSLAAEVTVNTGSWDVSVLDEHSIDQTLQSIEDADQRYASS